MAEKSTEKEDEKIVNAEAIDILILSNGPGEVTTWVRPVVKELRRQLGEDPRISVILSPCPHASGRETAVARSFSEVDRVQSPQHFWKFLLWGKTAKNWQWSDRGVVLFLGGDRFFAIAIARRLGYRSVAYAEWDARGYRYIDRLGVMKPEIIATVPPKFASKCAVVGDLMADVYQFKIKNEKLKKSDAEIVAILPGSKPAKLMRGVPFGLAVAEAIARIRPQTRFVIPVAPTLDTETLARFADPRYNAIAKLWTVAQLQGSELETASGLRVHLHTDYPAYDLLRRCRLCLTTVGANTAELGSLGVPMLVLIPTQQLNIIQFWDGLPGLLSFLPGVGRWLSRAIEGFAVRRLKKSGRLLAWPNIWAKKAIVPELVGRLQPQEVAELALDYLQYPEKLQAMGDRLRSVRGEPGAARKLVALVAQELSK